VGSIVDFEFALADGLSLLKGKGEVVRITQSPVPGMGVRFRELDQDSRKCLERIVATNEREGRTSRVSLDFAAMPRRGCQPRFGARAASASRRHARAAGLSVVGHDLQVRLTPLTVGYFTNNPLINIRLGGFVIPIDDEVSLGAASTCPSWTTTAFRFSRQGQGRGQGWASHRHSPVRYRQEACSRACKEKSAS
jgi:hypothetical protein